MDLFLVSEALGKRHSLCAANRGELSGTNPLTGWMVEDVSPAGTGGRQCSLRVPWGHKAEQELCLTEAGGSPQSSAVVSNLLQFSMAHWPVILRACWMRLFLMQGNLIR